MKLADGPDEARVVRGRWVRGGVRGGAGLGQGGPPEYVAVLPYSTEPGQAAANTPAQSAVVAVRSVPDAQQVA